MPFVPSNAGPVSKVECKSEAVPTSRMDVPKMPIDVPNIPTTEEQVDQIPQGISSDVREETDTTDKNPCPVESTGGILNKAQISSNAMPAKNNRFLALPREEQMMLRRAHQNLCHPSPEQLSTVLRAQGVRPELSQAVFDMECSTCAAHQRPKVARPSSLKDELDFNDKIFIDGITWTGKSGKSFHFYHILDQATNFHVAVPAPCRAAEQAVQCVLESWFQWAGPPNMMVTDSGTEFTSEYFSEFLQRHDVKPVTTAPLAHWQNGRCERHGQILQSMLDKIDHEMPIQTYKELQQALAQCTHAKNTLSIRKGYSPEVLVFGKSSRIPGSVTSCESMSSMASADRTDAYGIAFRRSLELREKARVAFHQSDNDQALRRACLRRTRPDRSAYAPGEWIMMWNTVNGESYWFGPLKVVAQESQNSLWATQGGKLYRRALEHVRPVCSSEACQIPHEEINPPVMPTQNSSNTDEIPTDNPPQHSPITVPDVIPETTSNQDAQSQSQDQPDTEPEANTPPESVAPTGLDPAIETPVPESLTDDDLVTTHLLCCEDEVMFVDPAEVPCAWRFELDVPSWLDQKTIDEMTPDDILMTTTDKKQRTEVKLSMLSPEEQKAFGQAKDNEVQNWLKTGTVSRILRSKLAPEQILRCR
eukprot:s2127_g16.t1